MPSLDTKGATSVGVLQSLGPYLYFLGHQPKHSLGKTHIWEPLCYLSLHDRKLALQTSILLVSHNVILSVWFRIPNYSSAHTVTTDREWKQRILHLLWIWQNFWFTSPKGTMSALSVILHKCTAANLFWKITVWAAGIYYDVIRKLLLQ